MPLGMLVIVAHHQNDTSDLRFKVPLVPFVPALSILFNLEFMLHLNILTWLRFFVWMIIGMYIQIYLKDIAKAIHFLGMLVYFLYGIHHSKEGEANSSYSILMTSSEAVKGSKWGATTTRTMKGTLTKRKASGEDRDAILADEEIVP